MEPLPEANRRRNAALPIAIGIIAIVIGVLLPWPSYLGAYRPAKQAYAAKELEAVKLRAEQQDSINAWGEIGSITLQAGDLDLANVAVEQMQTAVATAQQTTRDVESSPERQALSSAASALHRQLAIAGSFVLFGLLIVLLAYLRWARVGKLIAGAVAGAILALIAAVVWRGIPLDFKDAPDFGPTLVGGAAVGLVLGLAAALVAISGRRPTAVSLKTA